MQCDTNAHNRGKPSSPAGILDAELSAANAQNRHPRSFDRSRHVPGGRADDHFLMRHNEAEFFIELDVLNSVGLKITERSFLLECCDITIHQCGADSLSLFTWSHANGSEMNVGFL